MDMHQGQMCKIRRRSDGVDMGFYQKLRASDGKQRYYRVRVMEPSTAFIVPLDDNVVKTLESGEVDHKLDYSNTEYAGRPYEVSCILPAEVQARILLASSSPMEIENEIHNSVFAADLEQACRSVSRMRTNLQTRMRAYQEMVNQFNRYTEDLAELEERKKNLEDGEMISPVLYAYGKHTRDNREFCWRVPKKLENCIAVGDVAIGDTANGAAEFTVTRLERKNRLLPHKLVISVGAEENVYVPL